MQESQKRLEECKSYLFCLLVKVGHTLNAMQNNKTIKMIKRASFISETLRELLHERGCCEEVLSSLLKRPKKTFTGNELKFTIYLVGGGGGQLLKDIARTGSEIRRLDSVKFRA